MIYLSKNSSPPQNRWELSAETESISTVVLVFRLGYHNASHNVYSSLTLFLYVVVVTSLWRVWCVTLVLGRQKSLGEDESRCKRRCEPVIARKTKSLGEDESGWKQHCEPEFTIDSTATARSSSTVGSTDEVAHFCRLLKVHTEI